MAFLGLRFYFQAILNNANFTVDMSTDYVEVHMIPTEN
jgi:hypothetical protein